MNLKDLSSRLRIYDSYASYFTFGLFEQEYHHTYTSNDFLKFIGPNTFMIKNKTQLTIFKIENTKLVVNTFNKSLTNLSANYTFNFDI